ncbi:MAG: hypothetical protein HQK49_10435 [Oligoflexia bacterium]|nr:hypothetical protein [Oligoflexia bacterium]
MKNLYPKNFKNFKNLTIKDSILFLSIIFLLILISIANQKSKKIPIAISKQETALNFNKKIFEYINLGNKRLIVSWLWIQTLLESDHQQYKKRDANSWMFLRFDTIVSLDPLFLQAYRVAGPYLSVIKDDIVGANILYNKGLKIFPDDFYLNFYAGNNYFFELNDMENAYKHFERIQYHLHAPKYLPSIVAKIKAQMGDLQVAYDLISAAYKMQPADSDLKERYYESLYAIKAEIDLNCLNSNSKYEINKKCNIYDLDGNRYFINKSNVYDAIKKWKPFRINKFISK